MKKEILVLILTILISSCHLEKDDISKIESKGETSINFYDNGKLYTFGNYKNDSILHGPLLILFRNGNINVYDNYLNGVKEGVSVFYNQKGILIDKEYFRNGKRDGEQYYFDQNGDTLKIDDYNMGKLINTTFK